ncbi:MAG: PilT/PilU family type 4a pilus ATPase [Betaproteobacteria bacterium]|nr:PilT/PilU family type 4a pilus ATPase [Betaproteobacteria bacterium]
MGIQTWIGEAMARHASDIHLQVGAPAMMRVDGAMCALSPQALNSTSLLAWLQSFADAPWPSTLTHPLDCDGALTLPNLGRFRFNLMWHHHGLGMVLRPISGKVPTLEDLQCPAALADWSAQAHGLVLVTGPTGSGKTSTLAAMVDHINQHQSRHVITLEDPIEFVHTSRKGLVTQREVGRDTASFASGLRAALREDPDVIVVGELRDTESIRLALTAAETGHLVVSTLHTNSAASSITRLIDVFEPAEKAWVQAQLSESLLGIASQVLCPRANQPGRVAAFEVLRATPAVGQMIRDQRINQIAHALQTGARWGMHSLEQDLRRLIAAGVIDAQQAQHHLSVGLPMS